MNKRIKSKQCKYCGQYKRFSYFLECDEHFCVYNGCQIPVKKYKNAFKRIEKDVLEEDKFIASVLCSKPRDNKSKNRVYKTHKK